MSGPRLDARQALVLAAALAMIAGAGLRLWLHAKHPHFGQPRDAAAIAGLKTLATCQQLVAEQDRRAGGPGRVAPTLAALGGLLDPGLAAGSRQGYRFRLATTPDRLAWRAIAEPEQPGWSGHGYYSIGADGVVHESLAPIPLAPDRPLPAGVVPLGRLARGEEAAR